MEFSDLLEKLDQSEETNSDSEFSISRTLSLPLEFLVSFVRNRREAELLLKVSKSGASLDLLTQTYEMIASRAQGLQEAWNGLWLAQEPYIVPAIPLIGCEMSGVNHGRSMLLGKMDKEIRNLQELGKQLCHYIDVNCSLVEELRMEGIEKLATNKLLLVEVEKELSRRITHICNNKTVRDLSSMRQFLCQLRKPTSAGMLVTIRDNDDSATNGSCSTQKVTPECSSEARQRSLETVSNKDKDTESPDSQSFASKCVATQGDNMHFPPSLRYAGFISMDDRKFPAVPVAAPIKDIPSGPTTSASVRNHSSSASEERLPKVLLASSVYDGLPQVAEDGAEKHENTNETGAEEQLCGSSGRNLRVDTEREFDAHLNRVLLSEFGQVSSSTVKARGSELKLTQEPAQVDVMGPIDSNLPTSKYVGTEIAAAEDLSKHLEESKPYSHAVQSTQADQKSLSRKRRVERASSAVDGSTEETVDLVERKSKRTVTEGALESSKASTHASRDIFMAKAPDVNQGSCSNGSDLKAVTREGIGMTSEAPFGSSFTPCSCDHQQKPDSIPTLSALKPQARCNECGGFVSQSWIQQASQTSLEQAASLEACHVTESPVPATQ